MIPYKVQHIPKTATGRRPQVAITPKYLTIHSTGNTATAQNERDNLANNNPELKVSFHIVVDEKQAIECIPPNEVAWHAGDGRGEGNMASIGIEICEGGNREKTLQNAVELVAYLLKQYGWGVDRLRQHYDWSGKNCPRILRDKGLWNWFVSEVEKELSGEIMEEAEMIYNYIDENMPEWARPTIQKLVDKGYLKGDEHGRLGLNDTMLKIFVVHDRAGIYAK